MDASPRGSANFRKLVLILCLWAIGPQHLVRAQNSYPGYNTQSYGNQQGNDYPTNSGWNGYSNVQQPQPKKHYCTSQRKNFDCVLQNINLNYGTEAPTFGNSQNSYQKTGVLIVESRMDYLPKNLMLAFPNMMKLSANSLQIRSLQPTAFEYSSKLQRLFLSDNLIEQIQVDSFQGASDISILTLDRNRINYIDQYAISSMQNLKSFFISFNEVPSLPVFSYSPSLAIVNASHNALTQIDDNHFSHTSKLWTLDLSFNQLSVFNMQQLDFKTNLELVDVSSNYLRELVIPTHGRKLIASNNSIERLITNQRQCSVQELNLAKNKLSQQPDLRICRILRNLDLSHNLMESFNFDSLQSMSSLTHLNLQNNRLLQIELPTQFYYPLAITNLDLSSNLLSVVPDTKVLKNLIELHLHGNRLGNFDLLNKPYLQRLSLAFNQWDCAVLNVVSNLNVLDRQQEQCTNGFILHSGICCKSNDEQDSQSLQKIQDSIREIFIHKQQIQKTKKEQCRPQIRDQQLTVNQINNKLAFASNLEASREPILQEIAQVQTEFKRLDDQILSSQYETQTINNQITRLTKEVDQWRATYGIEREGLVNAKEILRRVVQFVKARQQNGDDLLKLRQEELSESQGQEQSKKNLAVSGKQELETLNQTQKDLKKKEQALKTERNALLAQVNKNSPSLKGT